MIKTENPTLHKMSDGGDLKPLGHVGAPPLVSARVSSGVKARPSSRDGRSLSRENSGTFEVLSSGDKGSSTSQVRPPSANSRSGTPIKQVKLPSVKRKTETVSSSSDWVLGSGEGTSYAVTASDSSQKRAGDVISSLEQMDLNPGEGQTNGTDETEHLINNNSEDQQEDEDDNSSDTDDDDDDDKDVPIKAPTELMMEFIQYIMEEEYQNAEKLCKMILQYEPNNPEANEFLPVIQEKIKQENEAMLWGSDDDDDSSDDEDDDDDEDSDDDDDDVSDDSDDSSEESDDDDD